MNDVVDIGDHRSWEDRYRADERRASAKLRRSAGNPPGKGPFASRPKYCVACGCRWATHYAWRNGALDGHCVGCAEASWGGLDNEDLEFAGATLLDLASAAQEEIDRRRV